MPDTKARRERGGWWIPVVRLATAVITLVVTVVRLWPH